MTLYPFITQLKNGESLEAGHAQQVFEALMGGHISEEEASAFLLALKAKGETITEIVAAAQVMRRHMIRAVAPEGAMDVCGTGGDNKGTLNVSTAVAIVVASCGVKVAKHGNRAVSSSSGSVDVLEALGIRTSTDEGFIASCFERAGICFLPATDFHPALVRLAPLRKKLGTRTIFNLLGPLCNPAGVTRQLVGVYSAKRVQPLAEALKQLGSEAAWVVHGCDGTDELSISGASLVATLRDKTIHGFELPLPDGIQQHPADALRGGDAAHNAAAIRSVLTGEQGPYRDAVILNAAAALIVGGRAEDLAGGIKTASDAIDSGRACDTINLLISLSKS